MLKASSNRALLVDSVDVLSSGEPVLTSRSRLAPVRVEAVVES
jgi:hypothetical protein